jgi:hypothetical protein
LMQVCSLKVLRNKCKTRYTHKKALTEYNLKVLGPMIRSLRLKTLK